MQTFSHCAWTFRWRSEDSISGRAQLEALSGVRVADLHKDSVDQVPGVEQCVEECVEEFE